MATPYAIVELESAESTQDEARARAEAVAPVLVIAGRQPGGRGRLGRRWVEPDQALYSSLAFAPSWPVAAWSRLPLVAGLAVREAIADTCGVDVALRWPNDLVIDRGKVGGVLVESGDGRVVVGCGINLVWDNPVEGAAALFRTGVATPAPRRLATAWVDAFWERIDCGPDAWGIGDYRSACFTIGRPVAYGSGSGTAIDVSPDGALLVETTDGIVEVRSGEVRLHDLATLRTDRRAP